MSGVNIMPWEIKWEGPDSDFAETIFFLGNGMLGVRGFGSWRVKDHPQDHAIFRAGFFSSLGHGITDMVQLPDCLTLEPGENAPAEVHWQLNMRSGVLSQSWETEKAVYRMERIVSMADEQLMVQRVRMDAKASASLTVKAIQSAEVCNLPVHDDQMVEADQLATLLRLKEQRQDGMALETIAEYTPLQLCWTIKSDRLCQRDDAREGTEALLTCALEPGESWTIEKRVRVLVGEEVPNPDSDDPWAENESCWQALWDCCDMEVEADDPDLQGAVRYNIFQMLCSNASRDRRVSIGARGLTHGRYKGNTFWDTEIFLLPFYLWTRPQAAKNLLLYRADRLEDAKKLAKRQNLAGARFPWMCSNTGEEQCESWDIGLCEVHVTADVTYAMERYVQVTGDESFRTHDGAELYRETARYWMSRLAYEPSKDCYSSFFVKGPDEYCGAAVNNTYTNYLARHNLALALRYGELSSEEKASMRFAHDRITLLYDEERKLFLQDELLERLEAAPFLKNDEAPAYKRVCFDRMQRYRVLKQADLVLLMTLFPKDFTPEQKRNVFNFYEPITLHDSTLSYGVHAQLALRLGLWEKAEAYLQKAVYLDLRDVMGNTGREGVHMAGLGAAWQALAFGAAGLWADEEGISLDPKLPPAIRRLKFRVVYRGRSMEVEVTHEHHTLREVK
ncbi:MAG: glycosyl hydrolase family 65 protein [Eubacteriales bacterium]|nr:glycosyl hydrolase family 65 protein [Eubacteriales bacterium]